jgi:hexosaminidase
LDHAPAPAGLERVKGPGFTPRSPYLPLVKVYAYDPAFVAATPAQEKQILGIQGQLWTEYIGDIRMVEYLAFPRLLALAEVAWTPQAARDYADFSRRLESGGRPRLDRLGVNQHRDTAVEIGTWNQAQLSAAHGAVEWDVTPRITAPGRFRVCLTLTNDAKNTTVTAAALLEDGREVSRDVHTVAVVRRTPDAVYLLDVPAPKPGAVYTVRAQISSDDANPSAGMLSWDLRPAEPNQ